MSDIVLDENSEQVTVLCSNLNVQGHDFLLDSPARRKPNGPKFRRALVHDQNDGLTFNFGNDYPGGVTISGVAEIIPQKQTLVVRGGISYEAEVLTGDKGQGAIEGETHTVVVNVNELLDAHNSLIVKLTARVLALEDLLKK